MVGVDVGVVIAAGHGGVPESMVRRYPLFVVLISCIPRQFRLGPAGKSRKGQSNCFQVSDDVEGVV